MDFSYSEEQTLLRNSVSAYLADKYTFEAWRKFTRMGEGRDPAHWRQFAELGLLAAPLPEAHGGLGGGAVDTMVIMEEFGKALVVEPYVPTVVIAGGTLARSGSEAQKARMAAQDRERRSDVRFCICGTRRALQSRRFAQHGEEARRRLRAERPQSGGDRCTLG